MQIIGAIVLVAIATVGLMLWHGDLKLPSEQDVQLAINKASKADWLDSALEGIGVSPTGKQHDIATAMGLGAEFHATFLQVVIAHDFITGQIGAGLLAIWTVTEG